MRISESTSMARMLVRYWWRDAWVRAGALGFAVALFGWTAAMAWWWPSESRHERLVRELHGLTRGQAEAERAVVLAEQVAQTRKELGTIDNKLEHGVEQAEWIESVARIASARQLKVMSQTVEAGQPQDRYLPLTLTVTAEGDYRGLRGLLESVPSLPVFCVVRELRVEAGAEHRSRLRAQLKLLAFQREDRASNRPPS